MVLMMEAVMDLMVLMDLMEGLANGKVMAMDQKIILIGQVLLHHVQNKIQLAGKNGLVINSLALRKI